MRAGDVTLAARMGVWRVALPVATRVMSTDRLVRTLDRPRAGPRDARREELAGRLAGRLWRTSDGPCLERSIALYRELGRMGAVPELVLGLAQVGGEAREGHAWVELDGAVLIDRDDPRGRYAELVRYRAGGAPPGAYPPS